MSWQQIRNFFGSRTGRLTLSYLGVIMFLTIIFSVVIYQIASFQIGAPLPQARFGQGGIGRELLEELFAERATQARLGVFGSLVFLNIVMLCFGAVMSYYLARRTLEPIESAMDAQAKFVSDASHELRTPLTAMQTTNEVALRRKKLTLDGAKEVIAGNIEEVMKLRSLTESLLGMAEQQNASLERGDVVVSEVVQEVAATLAPLAEPRSVVIKDETNGFVVHTNRAALQQILKVYLENAIAYAPDNSAVKVVAQRQNKVSVVSVLDQGPGVPKDLRRKVFERFYRVDPSRTTLYGTVGSGLGLAIAKSIADHQGFKLDVRSNKPAGAVFRIHIDS